GPAAWCGCSRRSGWSWALAWAESVAPVRRRGGRHGGVGNVRLRPGRARPRQGGRSGGVGHGGGIAGGRFGRARRGGGGRWPGGGGRVGLVVEQRQRPRADQTAQQRRGQRLELGIIVYICIQPVHHVVMGVGEQFLQGGVLDLGGDAPRHEGGEVGFGRQGPDVRSEERRVGRECSA